MPARLDSTLEAPYVFLAVRLFGQETENGPVVSDEREVAMSA